MTPAERAKAFVDEILIPREIDAELGRIMPEDIALIRREALAREISGSLHAREHVIAWNRCLHGQPLVEHERVATVARLEVVEDRLGAGGVAVHDGGQCSEPVGQRRCLGVMRTRQGEMTRIGGAQQDQAAISQSAARLC